MDTKKWEMLKEAIKKLKSVAGRFSSCEYAQGALCVLECIEDLMDEMEISEVRSEEIKLED